MKKLFLGLVMVFPILFFSSNVKAVEYVDNTGDFEVKNIVTGEILNDEVKVVSNTVKEVSKIENNLSRRSIEQPIKSYESEIVIEIPIVKDETPQARTTYEGLGENSGSLRVNARITFDISGDQVRVTSAASSFTPLSTYASVSNRSLMVQQGWSGLTRYPTSNAWTTYSTGWGFTKNTGGQLKAKNVVTGTVTMSGMSSKIVSATVYTK